MKFLKLSLAASVALGALSTASFAQPLEDAIKGIDVSGYLRYRYNDDRYDNMGNAKDVKGGNATHRWKAVADFKAPVADNVAFNFGILYNNESNNVNHGNGAVLTQGQPAVSGLGEGLGSGKDGSFGVSTFNAVITPDSTATTVIIGKQRLATPVTNAGDDDRGTGILALNSDITGLTLAAGAFDSWSIDDLQVVNGRGYVTGDNTGAYSVTKPLYVLAGIYNTETSFGNIGAQLWGFYIQDAVDALGVADITWTGSTFNASLQYALASLNNDGDSILHTVHGEGNIATNPKANIAEANDLFVLNLGADFAQDFALPLDVKLGWVTNFQDGTSVTLNDDGTIFKYAGAIWWQNDATGVTTSALLPDRTAGFGNEQELSVFYGAIGYRMLDERLRIGLDYVWGSNEITLANNAGNYDKDFQEITPRFSWKHNKNLTISGYYAYLMTDAADNTEEDEDRARARIEVKYSF